MFISYLPELLANSSACKNSPWLVEKEEGGGEKGSNMEKWYVLGFLFNEWILLLLQKGFLVPINYNKDIRDKVYCACLSIHSTFQKSLSPLIMSVLLITLMTEIVKQVLKLYQSLYQPIWVMTCSSFSYIHFELTGQGIFAL